MELNARQLQCLRTCMSSCQNVAYPSIGLVEELGEYLEKLLPLVEWNPDYADRPHLEMLIKGIIHNARCIGAIAKQARHGSVPIPFRLKTALGNGDPRLYEERIEQLRQELGDIDWMLNVADFYIVNWSTIASMSGSDTDTRDTTDHEVRVKLLPTAESLARLNAAKLNARMSTGTIDATGDTLRTPID